MKSVRIGNGAGYWGDNLDAPRRLAESGHLDYLTLEYLAELTLSILAQQRVKNPAAGYVADLPLVLESLVPALRAQPNLRVVSNGGGMNVAACARAAALALARLGLGEVPIAAVTGDDLLPNLDRHKSAGEMFAHFDSGAPLGDLENRLASANAYLGAEGIVRALAQGARIVITGRIADASLTVGPAVHEFGWTFTDWDKLAGASVAGHLIECGAQATGGMYSGWNPAMSLENLGYPLVELADDGTCVITKPDNTGGEVSVATVSEQLVYEIGDAEHYLTPDVDVDFSQVTLTQAGRDRVAVAGARGRPRPPRLKASLAYRDGYMATGQLVICGAGAAAKARACGELILARLAEAGVKFRRTHIECLGTGDTWPGLWPGPQPESLSEVVLRVSVHADHRADLERFLREFAPLAGSGPPGVTGYTGPRAAPYPVFAYWPSTIDRQAVAPTVEVRRAADWATP